MQRDVGPHHAVQVAGVEPRVRLPLYRSRVARGVMLVFGMTSLNFYSLATWLPSRLADAGLSEARGGAQLSLLAGLGLPVATAVPVLMDRFGRVLPLVGLFFVLLLAGELGLLLAPDSLTSLWSVAAGLGMGGFPLALTLVGLRSLTPASAGMLAGFARAWATAAARSARYWSACCTRSPADGCCRWASCCCRLPVEAGWKDRWQPADTLIG